jgi:hypothetical protein
MSRKPKERTLTPHELGVLIGARNFALLTSLSAPPHSQPGTPALMDRVMSRC